MFGQELAEAIRAAADKSRMASGVLACPEDEADGPPAACLRVSLELNRRPLESL